MQLFACLTQAQQRWKLQIFTEATRACVKLYKNGNSLLFH